MFDFTDNKGERHLINPSLVARISQAKGESYARVYLVGAAGELKIPKEKVTDLMDAVAKANRGEHGRNQSDQRKDRAGPRGRMPLVEGV